MPDVSPHDKVLPLRHR